MDTLIVKKFPNQLKSAIAALAFVVGVGSSTAQPRWHQERGGRDDHARSQSGGGRNQRGTPSRSDSHSGRGDDRGRGSHGSSSSRYDSRGHSSRSTYRSHSPRYSSFGSHSRSRSWSSFIFDIGFGNRRPVYEVVAPPVVIERTVMVEYEPVIDREIGLDSWGERPESGSKEELLEVWLGDESLLLDDGEYFRRGSEGLVWVPTPVGAVVGTLPIGVNTIWHEEREFMEFDGGYFRRSPDGFKVVTPPWADARTGGIETDEILVE